MSASAIVLSDAPAERVTWANPGPLTGVPTYSPTWLAPSRRGSLGPFFDPSTEAGQAAARMATASAERWSDCPHTLWVATGPDTPPPSFEVWYGSGDPRNGTYVFKLPRPTKTRRLARAVMAACQIADSGTDPGEPIRFLIPCETTAAALCAPRPPSDRLLQSTREMLEALWDRKGVAVQFVVTDRRYDGRGWALQAFLDGTFGGGAHGPAGPDQAQRIQGVNVAGRSKRLRLRTLPSKPK